MRLVAKAVRLRQFVPSEALKQVEALPLGRELCLRLCLLLFLRLLLALQVHLERYILRHQCSVQRRTVCRRLLEEVSSEQHHKPAERQVALEERLQPLVDVVQQRRSNERHLVDHQHHHSLSIDVLLEPLDHRNIVVVVRIVVLLSRARRDAELHERQDRHPILELHDRIAAERSEHHRPNMLIVQHTLQPLDNLRLARTGRTVQQEEPLVLLPLYLLHVRGSLRLLAAQMHASLFSAVDGKQRRRHRTADLALLLAQRQRADL